MEITEIDRNLTYYKILNEDENHNGLQYHTGLVEDILPFESDPEKSCCEGRIYITTSEKLPRFFGYGCWIRPCWIPEDAQALIDPHGDKIGVDKAFFGDRFGFAEYFDTLFDPERFDWGDYSWVLAEYCSDHFDKWFDPERYNWDYCGYLAGYCPDKKHIWEKYTQEVVMRHSIQVPVWSIVLLNILLWSIVLLNILLWSSVILLIIKLFY